MNIKYKILLTSATMVAIAFGIIILMVDYGHLKWVRVFLWILGICLLIFLSSGFMGWCMMMTGELDEEIEKENKKKKP